MKPTLNFNLFTPHYVVKVFLLNIYTYAFILLKNLYQSKSYDENVQISFYLL